MPRIFISYRRRDSAYVAGILRDALQERFGAESIFFDIDNIPFGVDFRQYISNEVSKCDALLVLIGDQWLTASNDEGKRRLDDPSDFVRIEIESALKREIPVVPVLVEDAKMPDADDLPAAIRNMAFRNAAEVRAGREQKQQIDRLVVGLEESCGARTAEAEKALAVAAEKKAKPRKGKAANKAPGSAYQSLQERLGSLISDSGIARTSLVQRMQKTFETIASNERMWIGDKIPREKALGAIKAYATKLTPDDVLLLYDNTVSGNAKNGLLLTKDAIYWRNLWSSPGCCFYAEIRRISFVKDTLGPKLLVNEQGIGVNQGESAAIAQSVIEFIEDLKSQQASDAPAKK